MFKLVLMLSLLNNLTPQYASIENIVYQQTHENIKKINFGFVTDYTSKHQFLVVIELYESNGDLLRRYSNNISIVGNDTSIANIECELEEGYFLIDVIYNDTTIVDDAKLMIYNLDDCYLNQDAIKCERIYSSEYKNGISKDNYLNLWVTKNIFNKFLSSNSLDLNEFVLYSDNEIENADAYFTLEEKINEYDLLFGNKYIFLLDIKKDNGYMFYLMENYYIDLLNFKFSEEYFYGSTKTDKIHFPYSEDYREYHCKILITTFINIEIEFNVATSELLFGDCSNSKFCLAVDNYD